MTVQSSRLRAFKRPVYLQLARCSIDMKLFLIESVPCLQGFFGMAFSIYEVVRAARITFTSLSSWGSKQANRHVFRDAEKKPLLAQRGENYPFFIFSYVSRASSPFSGNIHSKSFSDSRMHTSSTSGTLGSRY